MNSILKYLITSFFIIVVFLLYFKTEFFRPDTIDSLNSKLNGLKYTYITPVLNAKIIKGFNLIYCPTFQMAWKKLHDEIIKEPIIIDTEKNLLDSLNNSTIDLQLENTSYVAQAGFIKDDIINKINEELKSKFGFIEDFNNDLYPNDIISFSYFRKNLIFHYEFEKKEDFEFTSSDGIKSTNVKAFGINDYNPIDPKIEPLGKQIEILYSNNNSHIVKIYTQSDNDIIIVSTLPPKETLLESYNDIAIYLNNSFYDILKNESLIIPKINLNISHNYSSLEGKTLKNKQFTEYHIRKAFQKIQFELSEKGAKIESKALLELPKCEGIPRKMLFNKPFLLFMKKIKAKHPYFMIYVDNDEILKKG